MLQIYSGLERQAIEEEDLKDCDRLLTIFPNCPMIIGWKAHCLNILKGALNELSLQRQMPKHPPELEASEELFDQLLIKDPFRIEGIDVYSAILYVLRKKTKLSKLARRFSGMSRDRPEVCCVIGDLHVDHSVSASHV
jgi:anaphase-promoting complex subunit 8